MIKQSSRKSKLNTPSNPQVFYTITIEYDIHQTALKPPKLNIPYKGIMPTTVETFKVYLVCSNLVSEQVPVAINLNVHKGSARSNNTFLSFKRNKICKIGNLLFLFE
jgi:hypothetical protein